LSRTVIWNCIVRVIAGSSSPVIQLPNEQTVPTGFVPAKVEGGTFALFRMNGSDGKKRVGLEFGR